MRGSGGSLVNDRAKRLQTGPQGVGRAKDQPGPLLPIFLAAPALSLSHSPDRRMLRGYSTTRQRGSGREMPHGAGEAVLPKSKGTKINSVSLNAKYTEEEMVCF